MTAQRLRPGFTLLELMLALALTALLATVLYSSMYFGFKSRESATRSLDAVQKASIAFAMIAQDFDGALPPKGVLVADFTGSSATYGGGAAAPAAATGMGAKSSGLSTSNSSLNGTTGGLHAASTDGQAVVLVSFYSSANTPHTDELGCDLRKVVFSIETPEGSTKPALVRRVYYNLLSSKAPEPRVQVLCRNVKSCFLRYNDGTLWRDDWDSKGQGDILPNAVEVSLELDAPDSKPGDESVYKLTRVFALPCGVSAAQAASGSSQ